MDPSTIVTVLTVGGVLKAPAEEFLRRISGPAGDELGAWLQDKVRDYRARNALRTAARAQAMISAIGGEVREVPLRTLLPLVEGASIEDNEALAELWAALLANAADARGPSIPPIIPSVLTQLTPFDARVLSRISEIIQVGLVPDPIPPGRAREYERWGVRRGEIGLIETFADQLEASINTLVALGLVEHEPVLRSDNSAIFATQMNELRVSALGKLFLTACNPPQVRAGVQS